MAPEIVLVLMKTESKTISSRFRGTPKPWNILAEPDIEHVLHRFQEEFDDSLIINKFSLDTTSTPPDDVLEKFLDRI